jgi:hypothetical protein
VWAHPGNQHGLCLPFIRSKARDWGTYRHDLRLLDSGMSLNYLRIHHQISAAFGYDRSSGTWMSFEGPEAVPRHSTSFAMTWEA